MLSKTEKQTSLKSETIRIRRMRRDDLPQVLAIERESFPLPFSENLFHMELGLNIAHMLVAVDGETVYGYVDFWYVDNEMHVINIAVDPKRRGQGIGSLLMETTVTYAQEHQVEHIYLDVRESNAGAIALYHSYGFEQVDVRKGYYQDNEEDALVMVRKF